MPTPDPDLLGWEAAYQRFETSEQEVGKFTARLKRAGAHGWPRDARVVEIFCGRGSGLRSWKLLGFRNVVGIDLSQRLLRQAQEAGKLICADCRFIPLEARSADVVIVQGGLHHLPQLAHDLELVLAEAERILRPGGRFVAIEPWRTPFLRAVHFVSERRMVRALSKKLDALATMIQLERSTYEAWLAGATQVRALLLRHFDVERLAIRFGKIEFVGRKPGAAR